MVGSQITGVAAKGAAVPTLATTTGTTAAGGLSYGFAGFGAGVGALLGIAAAATY